MLMRNEIKIVAAAAILVLAIGCATGLGHNPLEGWKGGATAMEGSPYNKAITRDYMEYVQKLPSEEKQYVRDYNIKFFEDGTGRHAVKIAIPLTGIWWEHIIIYDRADHRMKVIKRKGGWYRS